MSDIVLRAVPDPHDPDDFDVAEGASRRRRANGRLRIWQQNDLMRELALGEKSTTELAQEYRVTHQYVGRFRKKYAREIAKIRKDQAGEYAHLWVAQKVNRLLVRQKLAMEMLARENRTAEDNRTIDQLLKSVAEELGELPPRQIQATASVTHHVVGVSSDELRESGLMP